MRLKIKKLFNLPRFSKIPNTTCDCCNKAFKPSSGQVQNIKKGIAKFVYCSKACMVQHKRAKYNAGLCSVTGCNCKATKTINLTKQLPRLLCLNHWEKWSIQGRKGRVKQDLKARFIVEPLIPTKVLNETKLAREEWFKLIVNDLCYLNYIRKNNEQYCGMVKSNNTGKELHLSEEDMFFIDLDLLVSFKRTTMTTNKSLTDSQAKRSKKLYEKNFSKPVRIVSAALVNDSDIADMDIVKFLEFLRNELAIGHKNQTVKLPMGVRFLNHTFNQVINTIKGRVLQWGI